MKNNSNKTNNKQLVFYFVLILSLIVNVFFLFNYFINYKGKDFAYSDFDIEVVNNSAPPMPTMNTPMPTMNTPMPAINPPMLGEIANLTEMEVFSSSTTSSTNNYGQINNYEQTVENIVGCFYNVDNYQSRVKFDRYYNYSWYIEGLTRFAISSGGYDIGRGLTDGVDMDFKIELRLRPVDDSSFNIIFYKNSEGAFIEKENNNKKELYKKDNCVDFYY